MTSSTASRYSSHHPIGLLPSSIGCPPGLVAHSDHHHHHPQQQQQQQQQQSHVSHGLASSMGMDAAELLNAHQAAQQRHHRLIADGQNGSGSMLSHAGQPTGGGLTQPLNQPQGQGQDPLQNIVQQLLCLQHLDYILGQRGHM